MLTELLATVRDDFSGPAAREDVAEVIRHHRIQASPGYRSAAYYVLGELRSAGLDAWIETYPANYESRFWNAGSFEEWEATEAWLHLVEPADQVRRLADYRELKLSVIQRSAPYEGEAEVVLLEDGSDDADYVGTDVAGKIVVTRGSVERVRELAVEKYGAVGLIFDGMRESPPVREAMDLPDARQYTSFWWTGPPGERQCFGFVLSPRQGAWLRQLIAQRAANKLPAVKVRARVDARFYPGQLEIVAALIPGWDHSQESVIIVSHLCHPQPSANDNATGVAANLECARTLQRLIARHELPLPRRNIRFLWMPEMTGSYAYLSRHEEEIPDMIAGLNLDMVGEDQEQTGSVLLLERPPDAAPSFAADLLERLREELYDDARTLTGVGSYPLLRYATTSFSGGSDHYIFSDPTVGVPMPMLIQWPDKFYHTSADTLDKVSTLSLSRSGTLAAAYAYFIANAGKGEATWLAYEMLARFRRRVIEGVQSNLTATWDDRNGNHFQQLERWLSYRLERFKAGLRSLMQLCPDVESLIAALCEEAGKDVERELNHARPLFPGDAQAEAAVAEDPSGWHDGSLSLVPLRKYRGPGLSTGSLAGLSPSERFAWRKLCGRRPSGTDTLLSLAEYWADGRRTVLEIVDLVELETGIRDAELILGLFKVLQQLGLVSFVAQETAK